MTNESVRLVSARRDAEEARAKFWGSVDELFAFAQDVQRRLEPSHLARDAWEAAKSKGADIAEDTVDAVRKRPIAATGAVAALALFIAREPLMDLAGKLMSSKEKEPAKGRRAKSKARKERVEKVDE